MTLLSHWHQWASLSIFGSRQEEKGEQRLGKSQTRELLANLVELGACSDLGQLMTGSTVYEDRICSQVGGTVWGRDDGSALRFFQKGSQ